jgi:translation elongation factor EF-Tu-like GTPase
MKKAILVVDNTFNIKNRGVVIAGFLEDDSPRLRTGDRIEILKPDGSEISSVVTGVEMIGVKRLPISNQKENIAFMVKDLSKEDVPVGSVISLNDE